MNQAQKKYPEGFVPDTPEQREARLRLAGRRGGRAKIVTGSAWRNRADSRLRKF